MNVNLKRSECSETLVSLLAPTLSSLKYVLCDCRSFLFVAPGSPTNQLFFYSALDVF